ncbi:hypothetical protein [Bradyrhizobium sp. S3.2.12]|uniref:hypothetical protein n=1 Tax=Bradyrhizobium sp. S3.2.12 TaxID=3156387 RepID=UPI00339A09FA
MTLRPLHDDFSTSAKIDEALNKRFPAKTRIDYLRLVRASDLHGGEHQARQANIRRITDQARELYNFIQDYERVRAHGEEVTADYTKQANFAVKERARLIAEANRLRNEPGVGNLPYERGAEFILDSAGQFKAVKVDARIAKGQSPQDALNSVREEILECDRAMRAARAAPLPLAEAAKQIEEDVRAFRRGPDVLATMRIRQETFGRNGSHSTQGRVRFPSREVVLDGGNREEVDEGVRFLCWLFPDQIIKKATAELEAAYKDKKPLSLAERTRVIAELESKKLDAERREEAIIRSIEDAGGIQWRRPLANMLAVLGIERAA